MDEVIPCSLPDLIVYSVKLRFKVKLCRKKSLVLQHVAYSGDSSAPPNPLSHVYPFSPKLLLHTFSHGPYFTVLSSSQRVTMSHLLFCCAEPCRQLPRRPGGLSMANSWQKAPCNCFST